MSMAARWTFARKIGVGFAVAVLLTVAMGAVAVVALRSVTASKDEVIRQSAHLLVEAERLHAWFERRSSAARGFLVAREERFIDELRDADQHMAASTETMKQSVDRDEGLSLIGQVARAEADHAAAIERIVALRRTDADVQTVARAFEDDVLPRREELDTRVQALVTHVERQLDAARTASSDTASAAIFAVAVIASLGALFSAAVALLLGRWLTRQITGAVGQVQSSSAELQSSATQQATGSREQATAMNEITTTINELLITSRQIAESAVRVAHIAEQTAAAARSGESTVDRAQDSIGSIRRLVDLVVNHMLELGKKSQQIGAVLDIVSDLAEQTNILAINATIEATGAGHAGERFAVVADEIRKLADRVTGSAKEIRGLIDEVRGAVNTTVMATETVSKAVEAGTREFGEVVGSLKEITDMVGPTTQAAREIELSTKQQSTAVEQVNVAVTDVAAASRESEASSTQTLQTASQLAGLSRDLMRLVVPQSVARARA